MIMQFGIGLVVTVLGIAIVAAFRARQLYVVVPRLFSDSLLTTTGKLAEIRVFNKGRSTEEDIRVTLDGSLRYEIVASTDNSPSLDGATICIPRVPPGDDYSVLIMVEGGDFSDNKVSTISSKLAKGSLLPSVDKVPPSFGNLLLGVVLLLALIAAPFFGIEYYYDQQSLQRQADREAQLEQAKTDKNARLERLDYLTENGWSELEQYSESDYRLNYSDGEFPIHALDIVRKGDRVLVTFRVMNEAAAELKLSIIVNAPYVKDDPEPWKSPRYHANAVAPKEIQDISVQIYWPPGSIGSFDVRFVMSIGTELYIPAVMRVDVDV